VFGNGNSLEMRLRECMYIPRMDTRETLRLPIPKEEIQSGCPIPGDVPMDNVDRSLVKPGAEMKRCVEATAIRWSGMNEMMDWSDEGARHGPPEDSMPMRTNESS